MVDIIASAMRDLRRYGRLIFELARNDFKSRYAGSTFGILWAFVQPLITILVFWFVFQVGFRVAPLKDGVPFPLWLSIGIVPWFFFADAWASGTHSFLEYSYLVKKVVFRVSFLPLIKVMSSLFIHVVFVTFLVGFCLFFGRPVTVHALQLGYYGLCTVALVVALSFFTASVFPFFRDLGQILAIVLQFGVWLTPIMWPYSMVPEKFQWIFKLNPMFYVVEGYRDALLGRTWFWERWLLTPCFWGTTAVLGIIGILAFRRLKPHFADVL